jgi:16S rRNA (guanine1207-N2)-methyltransferase
MPSGVIEEQVRGIDLRLATQPGVFAARGIDTGTRLLIEAMEISPTAAVLDLGCGYGVIGIVAAKLASRGQAVLVDSDVRATRLATQNLELNRVSNASVILGDGVRDLVPAARFDVVASNPPTHSGREVLEEFVEGAYAVLKPNGRLYLVINRLLSLKRRVGEVFGDVEVAERSRGFVVVRATKTGRGRN